MAERAHDEIMENHIPFVIATRNKGKIKEIRDLLGGYPVALKGLDDFGPVPPVKEDGVTFEENAYKKASFVARVLGIPALGDDSGLSVNALGGGPGVFSARYGGPNLNDQERCEWLLSEMQGKTDRSASFTCVISIAVPTGEALTYEAQCDGQITETLMGDNGFGYDPVFYYPPLGKSFAQLSMAEKSHVSHRGKALRELQSEFDKVLTWIRQHMPAQPVQGCMGK